MLQKKLGRSVSFQLMVVAMLGSLAGCGDKTEKKNEGPDVRKNATSAPTREEGDVVAKTEVATQPVSQNEGPSLPIRQMSQQEFEASWQVDVAYEKRPLGEVLQELTKPVPDWNPRMIRAGDFGARSNPSQTDKKLTEILSRPVTLKASRISRLEAIERACLAVQIVPVYDTSLGFRSKTEHQIQLHDAPLLPVGRASKTGPANSPVPFVQFFGPYRLRVTKLVENAPHAAGELELQVTRLPFPWESEDRTTQTRLEDVKISGNGGVDVKGRTLSSIMSSRSTIPHIISSAYKMKNLLRPVTELEISGQIDLKLPTRINTLWCDQIVAKSNVKNGPLALEIRGVSASSKSKGTFISYSGRSEEAADQVMFFAFDAENKPLKISNQSTLWAKTGGTISGSFMVSGRPTKLAMAVVSKEEEYSPRFTIGKIPLLEAAKQPEKLLLLEFAGHPAPLTVTVLKLDNKNNFQHATVKLDNHSNKSIEQAEVRFEILDDKGKVLKENPATLEERNYFSGESKLVAEKSTREREEVIFFFPEGGKKVVAQLKKVIFADGSEWQAEASPKR